MEALEDWYMYRQNARRVESVDNDTVAMVYQCPVMACAGNNTCKGGRTGMLCGYCPEDWALELNTCVSCGSVNTSAVRPTQIAFGILGSLFVMLVLFLLGWRYVFPGNILHRCYDRVEQGVLSFLRRVVSTLSKAADKRLPNIDLRLVIQAGKLFFGNLQVVSSFTRFKVEFPDLLTAALRGLQVFSMIFTLEIFSWPGLGCLTELEYISKLAVRTLLPLFIVFLMAVPVAVSWWIQRRVDVAEWDENRRDQRVAARNNLAETQDACWNNIFTFLFLVFPASALASMEPFSCRKIGNRWFLNADLRLDCPTAEDGMFWFSVVTTLIWVVGVPLFTVLSMRFHEIHRLAQKKQDGAFVSAMIDRFHADTADPSRQSLANIIGNPLKKDPRDEVARNLKIRSNELFTQLFPEHAKPHRAGHLLPKVPRLILKKLLAIGRQHGAGNLYEHSSLKKAIRDWFRNVDTDLDARVSLVELRFELDQMGLENAEVDSFILHVQKHVGLVRGKEKNSVQVCDDLQAPEFERIVLHVLDECIPALSCFELMALFDFVEAQDDMTLDSEMFYKMMEKMCRNAFEFTGTESLDILTTNQLQLLLEHKWERREHDADNGVVERNMHSGLDATDKVVEVISSQVDGQFTQKEENYVLTERQERKLKAIWRKCKIMRQQLGMDDANPNPFGLTLQGEEWSIVTLTQVLKDLAVQLDGLRQSVLESSHAIENSFPNTEPQGLSDTTDIDACKLQLVMWNSEVQEILRDLVADLGLRLNRSGVISVPALKWDGSLGPEEELVIRRFGFLINAFQVVCWYWEVVEMYRKFLLTGLMVVLFDGSAPHLLGALIITFLFIISHLTVDPYLNKGLNDFQRLALVTQFFTILGGVIYLLVSVMEELYETKPSQEARDASKLLEFVLLFLNVLIIILYPCWALVKYLSSSRVSLRSKMVDGCITVASYIRSLFEVNAVEDHLQVDHEDEALYSNVKRLVRLHHGRVPRESHVNATQRPAAVAAANTQSSSPDFVFGPCGLQGHVSCGPHGHVFEVSFWEQDIGIQLHHVNGFHEVAAFSRQNFAHSMRNQLLQNQSSDSGASAHNQDTTTVPGPAALCGKIEIGDRVVRVNDENCSGRNSNEVDVLLRDASRPVTLLFERPKAGGSGATSTVVPSSVVPLHDSGNVVVDTVGASPRRMSAMSGMGAQARCDGDVIETSSIAISVSPAAPVLAGAGVGGNGGGNGAAEMDEELQVKYSQYQISRKGVQQLRDLDVLHVSDLRRRHADEGLGIEGMSKTDQKKLECLLRELDPVTGPAKALEQHALSSFAIRGEAQTSVESGLSGVVDQAGVAGRPSSSDVTQKVVPDNLFLAVQCNVCGRSATSIPGGQLLACGRCQKVKYCSSACQHQHWPEHRNVCKPFEPS